jgi:benzoyl-CoA 2,3-dioxygenase component B
LQKYLNFHYSVTSDLYGSEISSNAASFYANGLKGRFDETKIGDDHRLQGSEYPYMEVAGDRIVIKHAPALTALNERLRDDWIADVQAGIDRWNKIPEKAGMAFRFKLPHKGFHRRIGLFTEHHISPDGKILSEAEWTHLHAAWLPTEEDRAYVCSLMGRVAEPGKFANWIAPPARGINNQPANFEYVRFN